MVGKMMRGSMLVLLVCATAATVMIASEAGRYKKDGTKCVWDDKDTGPNQCTPVVAGHFKKDGANCHWVAGDAGADQCRPSTGRFKKDGAACVWNGTDTGPDQCDPKAIK